MIGFLLLALLAQSGVAAQAQSGTITLEAPPRTNAGLLILRSDVGTFSMASEVRFVCRDLEPFTLSDIRAALESAAQALPPAPDRYGSIAFSVPAIHTTPPSDGDVLREKAKRADQRDQAALSVEATLAKIVAWEACIKKGGGTP